MQRHVQGPGATAAASERRLFVWAPACQQVEIEVAGGRRALERGERGYWTLPDPPLPDGARYAFRLDGSDPLPDPRSDFQPEGVHGPSVWLEHGAFHWNDVSFRPEPLERAVIYELHVGTYSPEGTFDGCRARLDHLVELGVTHVELMPVVEFSGRRGWGYDGVDLFAPHHAYGTPDDLKRLVDACHGRGLAVLLDVVYNHLGPEGNYLERFGPYFTSEYATPWGKALNFDGAASDEVRRFFCDNALYWLEHYHFDGLRLDAVHAILDRSARPFLEQLADEVRDLSERLGRRKVLIAESDLNDPRLLRAAPSGGHGLDAQWSDDFHHALHALATGESTGYYADFGALEDLARALTRGFVYAGQYSEYRRRAHGRPIGEVPLSRLFGYIQNHDQIGNRAVGDRIGAALSPGQLEAVAALVLLGPFVPMVFQGEEWNASSPFCYFTDHQDPGLAEAVRTGRRREFVAFGWSAESIPDPQADGTFEASKLRWAELLSAAHRRCLDWYRALIRLRRSEPSLDEFAPPDVTLHGRCLVLRRGELLVACNFGADSVELPSGEATHLLLGTPGSALSAAPAGPLLRLPPGAAAVLRGAARGAAVG